MALLFDQVASKVESLRRAATERDERHKDVRDARASKIDAIAPGSMPDAWPKPIVANAIDVAARDLAESMGSMPSINCSSGVLTTDKAKKFSNKRTKIANHYVQYSHLDSGHMVEFCDHYSTFGYAIFSIEPDFEDKMPRIRVENPMGTYPEIDLYGRIKSYAKVWREPAISLVAKFPQLIRVLQHNETGGEMTGWAEREIEVVKYIDGDQILMYLPQHGNQLCSIMANPMGKIYMSIACRPGYDQEVRGAFDDAVWVQLAKARMALLALEATEKSVRAPLAVPRDLQNFRFGDDAILRTDNPEKIVRVGIDVPQYAFQEGNILSQEMQSSMRVPEIRGGQTDASIITGRGVQALMGGFNTVISTGQNVVGQALKRALMLCFEMDEFLWPDEAKVVSGVVQGTPFVQEYVPAKDIDHNYTVDVTYGFASGQDPARAIVALLQLRGDQLVSRDFVQRQLPMDLDVGQLQTQIDNEQMTDALKQAFMGMAQAIPQMAMQGGDPSSPVAQIARVMELREKGVPFHEAALKVLTPKEAPANAPGGPPGAPAAPGGPGGPGGAGQPVLGPAQAQGGMDIQRLLAGLGANGQPTMEAVTRRQSPIG